MWNEEALTDMCSLSECRESIKDVYLRSVDSSTPAHFKYLCSQRQFGLDDKLKLLPTLFIYTRWKNTYHFLSIVQSHFRTHCSTYQKCVSMMGSFNKWLCLWHQYFRVHLNNAEYFSVLLLRSSIVHRLFCFSTNWLLQQRARNIVIQFVQWALSPGIVVTKIRILFILCFVLRSAVYIDFWRAVFHLPTPVNHSFMKAKRSFTLYGK